MSTGKGQTLFEATDPGEQTGHGETGVTSHTSQTTSLELALQVDPLSGIDNE
jgi:hypothetical protein